MRDTLYLYTRTQTETSSSTDGTRLTSALDEELAGTTLDHFATITRGRGDSWLLTVLDEQGNDESHEAFSSFIDARDTAVNILEPNARWVETRKQYQNPGWVLSNAKFYRVVNKPCKMVDVTFKIERDVTVSTAIDPKTGLPDMNAARESAMEYIADNGFSLIYTGTSAAYDG